MSRAFVKEGDSATSGSLVDRFYQGLLGLSDPARTLIARRQQQAWLTSQAARRDAQAALGADSYKEIFESAAERAGDPQGPTWWAAGDAATAIAARRRLSSEQFLLLVAPLSVALPWLRDAANQT